MSYETINVEVDEYLEKVESIKNDGYEMMVDLTAVDWYRKREPRFQLVVNFLSVSKNSRIILNVNVFCRKSKLEIFQLL